MKKEQPLRIVAFKLAVLYWLVAACLALFVSCSSPREQRGDWMEHLNDKQFNFRAPMIAWDRHNYYSLHELKEMWAITYEQAITNLDTE